MQPNIGEIPLSEIYLDPNNYRFRDHKDYRVVGDNNITNPQVQKRTYSFIVGKNNTGIADLIASFKKSGFLPVDQIQVVKVQENIYKVIEGNRRIATLKFLQEENNKGNDIGSINVSTFDKVPVVFYKEEQNNDLHYKVLMGLKHINGNKRWPIVNQAQLMKDMSDSGMSEDDIIDSLGISKTLLRRSLRALALIQAYKASDYGDQFQADMYNIFDSTVSSTNIKYWLEWDDTNMEAQNKQNQERFFSWISTVESIPNDDDEEQNKNLIHKREPIVTTGRDVRELTKFIKDETAIRFMEESGSIADAYLSSDLIGKDKFDTILNALESNLNTALSLSSYANSNHTNKFENINKKLNGLIASQSLTGVILPKAVKPNVLFNFPHTTHFQSLNIKSYKGLSNLVVNKLNKINLFAGENNAGKTSLLEAIRLLIAQNDANNFLALQELRGKFAEGKMQTSWVVKNVNDKIEVEGRFGLANQKTSLTIEFYKETDETFDSNDYLGSFKLKGSFIGQINESVVKLFEKDNSYELSTKGLNHLCSFAYYSPFGNFRNAELYNAHAKSEETKYISKVIDFLKSSIDEDILGISLVEENGLKSFLVNHEKFKNKIDLLQFGDGLQNIFKTTLLFAIAENGIVLIDEMGTAIHHSLLIEYSMFIQKLSEEFNTQVFITSHSDECIDAFVENDYSNDNVSMYHLENEDGISKCRHITGNRYKELNELMGIDLRD